MITKNQQNYAIPGNNLTISHTSKYFDCPWKKGVQQISYVTTCQETIISTGHYAFNYTIRAYRDTQEAMEYNIQFKLEEAGTGELIEKAKKLLEDCTNFSTYHYFSQTQVLLKNQIIGKPQSYELSHKVEDSADTISVSVGNPFIQQNRLEMEIILHAGSTQELRSTIDLILLEGYEEKAAKIELIEDDSETFSFNNFRKNSTHSSQKDFSSNYSTQNSNYSDRGRAKVQENRGTAKMIDSISNLYSLNPDWI